MNDKPIGAGKSSFDLIEPELFFDILPLDRNLVFLDIRLTVEDVEGIVAPYGFRKDYVNDVGPYNYLVGFKLWY